MLTLFVILFRNQRATKSLWPRFSYSDVTGFMVLDAVAGQTISRLNVALLTNTSFLNPRPAGPLDFPPHGGGELLRIPSISAPGPCSDTR